MEAIDRAFAAGVGRVILGTAAGERRASAGRRGAEIWREDSRRRGPAGRQGRHQGLARGPGLTAEDFLRRIEALGVRTVICTDIS